MMSFELMLINRLAGGGYLPLLIIIVSFCLGAGASGCSRLNSSSKLPNVAMTQIYGEADWYRARPEPEQQWRGELRERDVIAGPTTRTALIYRLVTTDKEIPVYAANVEQKLALFVGRQVLIYGKLVDLSREGFGQELWIASIRTLP